ncbi:MAG: phosphoribosyltransferase family protein, partial [Oscillospiraceae bacterium]
PFFYTGIAAQAIQALKFQNKSAYARSFGHILAEIIAPKKDLLDCILAIPMTDTDIRKRGYSQSALIARFLGERLNVPVERGNLVKIHQTEKQHFLNQEERRVNLEGAFGVRHPERLKGKSVLICDDVLTTGSTLREVAKTLNQHEVLDLYAAVISTTDHLDNL